MREKSHLVTNHLISSVDWFWNAPNSIIKPEKGGDGKTTWAENAKNDLVAMLSRKSDSFPEAARRGVEFEKMVYDLASRPEEELPGGLSEELLTVINTVRGMKFNEKFGMHKEIAGYKCYLYAKFDAIKSPLIIDIKATASYSFGKYLRTHQHKFYCYNSGAEKFVYLIAEWEKDEDGNATDVIKEVHQEQYEVTNRRELEIELEGLIENMFTELKEAGLWNLYRNKYCKY